MITLDVVSVVPEPILIFKFCFFFLFVVLILVISTILPSCWLIHSSVSPNLRWIPSSLFLISCILFFSSDFLTHCWSSLCDPPLFSQVWWTSLWPSQRTLHYVNCLPLFISFPPPPLGFSLALLFATHFSVSSFCSTFCLFLWTRRPVTPHSLVGVALRRSTCTLHVPHSFGAGVGPVLGIPRHTVSGLWLGGIARAKLGANRGSLGMICQG